MVKNITSIVLKNTVYQNNKSIVNVDLQKVSWTNDNMIGAFYQCTNLYSVKNISNTVTNMIGAFANCNSLKSIPTIPNSVTNIGYLFYNCNNLEGNLFIKSANITNASNAFSKTDLEKNVFIPFKYENGVNTSTYNSFINFGYSDLNRKDGVLLYDISNYIQYDFFQTNIEANDYIKNKPTNLSQFNNDLNYATTNYVSNLFGIINI